MKKLLISHAVVIGLLTACSDGVPKIADPRNPVVNGQALKPREFLQTYCHGKPSYESATCQRVKTVMAQDAARPNLPRGW